ncbi:hypothetical protein [Pseudomonas asiatica]|uniref:hypothetical protein n=1 Tax=Pseudomonas asiatica TaxID=2219225 RepID=UPI0032ECE0BC
MNAVKKEDVTPSRDTQLKEADLEVILHYLRSAHPRPEDLKIKNFKRILIDARKHEADEDAEFDTKSLWSHHLGSKWATALSSSAVAGLATAITAPTIPFLVVATAAAGLVAGWVAANKIEDTASDAKKPD